MKNRKANKINFNFLNNLYKKCKNAYLINENSVQTYFLQNGMLHSDAYLYQ